MRSVSEITKNLSRAVSADSIVLLVSVFVTVLAPRFLGVTEYGYWQIYLFYGAYVQIAQFGWSDGLLVRHSGMDLGEANQARWFTGQLLVQFVLVLAFASLLSLASLSVESDEAAFVILALAVSVVVSNCRFMCLRLFQASRQMRQYSLNIAVDRLIFGSFAVAALLVGVEAFEVLIIVSLTARVIALIAALISCKPFLTARAQLDREVFREAGANISSGLRTLTATYAGLFTIGVVRLLVERSWGVDVFSNVSLALNVTSLVTLFVSGISFAILPYVRRAGFEKQKSVYYPFRSLVSSLLIFALILYYPITSLFQWWLPQYDIAADILYLLFPVVLFEGRTALLTVTYLRSARKETALLIINLCSLIFSAAVGLISVLYFDSLGVTVSVILISVILKSVGLEMVLLRSLGLTSYSRVFMEILIALIFLLSVYTSTYWYFWLFALVVVVYFILVWKDLKNSISIVKGKV